MMLICSVSQIPNARFDNRLFDLFESNGQVPSSLKRACSSACEAFCMKSNIESLSDRIE